MISNQKICSVTLVGGRGYVGQELIKLIDKHPYLELTKMSSRQWQGQNLGAHITGLSKQTAALRVESFEAEALSEIQTDIIILALPNGLAQQWVGVAEKHAFQGLIVDLSTDFRFDPNWQYGLPELHPVDSSGPARISNPGCYATAMQLTLYPIRHYCKGIAHCFGVSGYSGAGTQPSDYNDPIRLKDNLLPYKLVDHVHQKEVSHHLQTQVRFIPHVAQFFSGINMTVSVPIKPGVSIETINSELVSYYRNNELVDVITAIPEIQMVSGSPKAVIGGLAIDPSTGYLAVICCLDNLQKGAASQAVQNINQYCGHPDSLGLI